VVLDELGTEDTVRIRPFAVPAIVLLLCTRLWALDLVPLKDTAASLHWDGPQFIQADARGTVFLLRGDTLQVYPVTKAHDLGEPVQLETDVRSGIPLDAALSADGSWVLNLGGQVHYFVDRHEKSLPALVGWVPVSVGFLRDEPVAMVVPHRGSPQDNDRRGPPLLLRPSHDTWSAEIREALHAAPDDVSNERAFRAVLVLDAHEGRYFLARQYAYRIELRHLGREQPLEELRLGKGEPVFRKSTDVDERRLVADARAAGAYTDHGTISAFRGVSAILALVRRPGDRLYALIAPGAAADKSCALDRIDWEARRVERLSLNLPCPGRVSMAAGRDGMYFAEFDGAGGRYFGSWTDLDAAHWRTVKEAEFLP
jgi:hypothetical protein